MYLPRACAILAQRFGTRPPETGPGEAGGEEKGMEEERGRRVMFNAGGSGPSSERSPSSVPSHTSGVRPHRSAGSPLNPKNFILLFVFVYSISVKSSALQEAVGASVEEKARENEARSISAPRRFDFNGGGGWRDGEAQTCPRSSVNSAGQKTRKRHGNEGSNFPWYYQVMASKRKKIKEKKIKGTCCSFDILIFGLYKSCGGILMAIVHSYCAKLAN